MCVCVCVRLPYACVCVDAVCAAAAVVCASTRLGMSIALPTVLCGLCADCAHYGGCNANASVTVVRSRSGVHSWSAQLCVLCALARSAFCAVRGGRGGGRCHAWVCPVHCFQHFLFVLLVGKFLVQSTAHLILLLLRVQLTSALRPPGQGHKKEGQYFESGQGHKEGQYVSVCLRGMSVGRSTAAICRRGSIMS